MKKGDHVRVKDNHVTREKNLHGRYGHILELHGSIVPTESFDSATIQFNDFSERVHLCDLDLA